MSWQYAMRSCCVTAYAILTSTSRTRFCISFLCSWTNPSQRWNTSLYRPQKRHKLSPSEDISCPKSTPPHAARHRSSKKITIALTLLRYPPRHTRAHEHPSFWLLSPEAISGTSSVPSPTRGTVHWFFHPHSPSQRREGTVS